MPRSSRSKGDRRKMVWKKSNGLCAHCGNHTSAQNQTVDHIIPKSLGGTDDLRNLMPLCRKCNAKRTTKDIDIERYYAFATKEAIRDFKFYRSAWEREHMDSTGELILKTNGTEKMYGGPL